MHSLIFWNRGEGLGFRVVFPSFGSGFRVRVFPPNFGIDVQGLGFRVSDLGSRAFLEAARPSELEAPTPPLSTGCCTVDIF